jgi:hypothetical protein
MRQQGFSCGDRVARLPNPAPHLGHTIHAPAAPELEKLAVPQAQTEMKGRLPPGLTMTRFRIEQQAVEIKQAGGGTGHQPSLTQGGLCAGQGSGDMVVFPFRVGILQGGLQGGEQQHQGRPAIQIRSRHFADPAVGQAFHLLEE